MFFTRTRSLLLHRRSLTAYAKAVKNLHYKWLTWCACDYCDCEVILQMRVWHMQCQLREWANRMVGPTYLHDF